MSYQIFNLVIQALVLFCDLQTVGYSYQELRKYLATNSLTEPITLSGYTADELTVRPLNQASYAKYSQLSSPGEFLACFQMVLPSQEAKDIPAYRSTICTHYNLYQFPAFIALVRQFPEYPNHLLELVDRMNIMDPVFRTSD